MIPHIEKGTFPTRDDYNKIVDHVNAQTRQGWGFETEGGWLGQSQMQARFKYVPLQTAIDIPRYSLFSIAQPTDFEPVSPVMTGNASKIGVIGGPNNSGSQLDIMTNDLVEGKAGSFVLARAIGHFDDAMVNYDGDPPDVGHACGVAFDSFNVTPDRFGLVCTAPPDYDDHIRVRRTPAFHGVWIEVTTAITPFDGANIGTGAGKILNRDEGLQTFVDGIDPNINAAPFTVDVQNVTSRSYAIGELVQLHYLQGVGLSPVEDAVQELKSSFSIGLLSTYTVTESPTKLPLTQDLVILGSKLTRSLDGIKNTSGGSLRVQITFKASCFGTGNEADFLIFSQQGFIESSIRRNTAVVEALDKVGLQGINTPSEPDETHNETSDIAGHFNTTMSIPLSLANNDVIHVFTAKESTANPDYTMLAGVHTILSVTEL
jgi:hypothetical protein